MGDFNIDLLHDSSKADRLLANIESYQFCHKSNTATRVASETSTLFDYVYVRCPERIAEASVLPVGMSDQFAVLTVYTSRSN